MSREDEEAVARRHWRIARDAAEEYKRNPNDRTWWAVLASWSDVVWWWFLEIGSRMRIPTVEAETQAGKFWERAPQAILDDWKPREKNFENWLYQRVERELLDARKTSRRHEELNRDYARFKARASGETTEQLLERKELFEALGQALQALPADERDVVTRLFWEDWSLKAIAEQMGISEDSARRLRDRGLGRLLQHLKVFRPEG